MIMAGLVRRPRLFLFSSLSQRTTRSLSSSSSSASTTAVPEQEPASSEEPETVKKKKGLGRALKFGIWGALLGSSALAGYATYAYTSDEVDQKTAALRESAKYTVHDDASSIDIFKKIQAFLRSAVISVPAKSVELYLDVRRLAEERIKTFREPYAEKLLPDLHPQEQHVFTLVLDLNETLIYCDWKRERGWRTFKRPGVEAFLEQLGQYYEIIVFSDQIGMFVDPICDRLDNKGYIRHRLSRPATTYTNGVHYRDLSKLNRDPSRIIYISGHALESCLQHENSVQVTPWKLEANDTALIDLIPFLEYVARFRPSDIRTVLASYQGRDVAKEFLERSREHQRKLQEQKQHGPFWRR